MPHAQLATSGSRHQKRRLNNSIILCVSRPKCNILPFDEEIDASATHILNHTEHDKDDEEFSDNESLNPENLEFHQPPKRKRSTNIRELPENKKTHRYGATTWKQHHLQHHSRVCNSCCSCSPNHNN